MGLYDNQTPYKSSGAAYRAPSSAVAGAPNVNDYNQTGTRQTTASNLLGGLPSGAVQGAGSGMQTQSGGVMSGGSPDPQLASSTAAGAAAAAVAPPLLDSSGVPVNPIPSGGANTGSYGGTLDGGTNYLGSGQAGFGASNNNLQDFEAWSQAVGGQGMGDANIDEYLQFMQLMQQSNPAIMQTPYAGGLNKGQPWGILNQGLFGGWDAATGMNATGLKPHEGGAALAHSLDTGLAEYMQGGLRGQEREDIMRMLATQASGQVAAGAGQQLGVAGTQLANQAMAGERFNDLERNMIEQNAQGLQNSQQRMQDLGMTGTGVGQAPALASLDAQYGSALRGDLAQLEQLRGQEGRADLEAAGRAAGISSGLFQQTQMDPAMQLISMLGGPQNTYANNYMDQLERSAQLAQGTALTSRSPDTFSQLAPLLGGGINAAGSIIGGYLSGGGGGGGE